MKLQRLGSVQFVKLETGHRFATYAELIRVKAEVDLRGSVNKYRAYNENGQITSRKVCKCFPAESFEESKITPIQRVTLF